MDKKEWESIKLDAFEKLAANFKYEVAEGFICYDQSGKICHTTNEELGIDETVFRGLKDVLVQIDQDLKYRK